MKKNLIFFVFLLAASRLFAQCADSIVQQYWTSYKASSADVAFRLIDVTHDGKTVLAASGSSRVIRSSDGGCTWNESTVGNPANPEQFIFSVTALNDSTGFICVKDFPNIPSHLYRTTDGGVSWDEPLPGGAYSTPGNRVFFAHFFNPLEGVVCGIRSATQLEFYTTDDGGGSWLPVSGANLPAITGNIYFFGDRHATVGNTIWVPTSTGLILRSTDKGRTWTAIQTPTYPSLSYFYSVAFRDSLHGIYNTDLNGDFRTTDGGQTWTPLATSVPGSRLKRIPDSKVYFARTNNTLAVSLNDGDSWYEMDPWTNAQIMFLDPKRAWSGSNENGIVQRWNGKTTIGRVEKPTLAIAKRKHLAQKPFSRPIVLLDMGLEGNSLLSALNVVAPDNSVTIVQPGFGNINLPPSGTWKYNYEFAPASTGVFDFQTFAYEAFSGETFVENSVLLWVTDTMIAKGDVSDVISATDHATGGESGSRFDFSIADTLTGLSVYYAGSYEPGWPADLKLRFNVRKIASNGNTPGELLYQSPYINLAAADTQSMIYHPLMTPLLLAKGSYIVTFEPMFSDGEYRRFGFDPMRVDSAFWYKFDAMSSWETGVAVGAGILRLHLNSSVLTPSMEPTKQAAYVRVYPNPTTDYLHIDFTRAHAGRMDLQLIDMSGRIVIQQQLEGESRLGLKDVPPGMYFVKLTSTSGIWTEKIMVR